MPESADTETVRALASSQGELAQKLSSLEANALEIASFANELLKDQEKIAAHSNTLAAEVARCEQSVERLRNDLAQEAARLRKEMAERQARLESSLHATASRLESLRESIGPWQQNLAARVDAVEAGWDGMQASAQDLLSRIHVDNERQIAPWRELADSIERRLATLEAAWPMLSRAIPESVFRKVRLDMARVESKLTELTRRLDKKSF